MAPVTAARGVGGGRLLVLIAARRAGRPPDAASAALTPNVLDGARGVAFIEASVASSRDNGAWTSAQFV